MYFHEMWFITSLTYNLLLNISYNILHVAGHPDNYLPFDVELAHWKKFSWEHILSCVLLKLLSIIPSFTFKLPSNIPYDILYAAGYRDNYLPSDVEPAHRERVKAECLHATELFVIVQCTYPDIIFLLMSCLFCVLKIAEIENLWPVPSESFNPFQTLNTNASRLSPSFAWHMSPQVRLWYKLML